jgi:hypothetical protein
MSAPEAQFRPIPLTIVDLIAIFLPGFLWLILVATTLDVIRKATPVVPWRAFQGMADIAVKNWIVGLGIVAMAALVGYVFKPLALQGAEGLVRIRWLEPVLKFATRRHYRKYAEKMGKIRVTALRFPFDAIHQDEAYFSRLKDYFEHRLGCAIESRSGYSLFMFVKRHLRLASPAVWEECERLEAEVRMSASTLLAVVYSLLLSMVAMVRYRTNLVELSAWFLLSAVACFAVVSGFMHIRDNEVSYAYVNCLLVVGESGKREPPGE